MKNTPDTGQPLVTLKSYISSKSSQTLLEFLCGRFKYHAPEEWKGIIEEGRVQVNDRKASPGQPLRAGDEVAYTTSSWKEPEVRKDFRVLHEDDALAILSKPAPLPVHAIGAYFKNTLMYLLREARPEARDWHLVHRLDSETSGLLVLAKDAKYLKTLQRSITPAFPTKGPVGAGLRPAQSPLPEGVVGAGLSACPPSADAVVGTGLRPARSSLPEGIVGARHALPTSAGFIKSYRAIVFGTFPEGTTTVDAPIGPKKGSEVRMKLMVVKDAPPAERGGAGGVPSPSMGEGRVRVEESPKPSLTEFSLLERKGDFSLIEARPLTGRTHQIRVHLEHLGFPIVGDKLYAGDDETFLHFYEHDWDEWMEKRVLLPRMALHAFGLEFIHPATGQRVRFEDPLPPDLSDFWKNL